MSNPITKVNALYVCLRSKFHLYVHLLQNEQFLIITAQRLLFSDHGCSKKGHHQN